MLRKIFNLLLVGFLSSGLVFGFSFLFLKGEPAVSHLPVEDLVAINALADQVSEILEKRESLKNSAIQALIDQETSGQFHLLYRDWKVKLHKSGEVRPKSNNRFFNWIDDTEFSVSVPVGKNEVKGILVVTRTLTVTQPPSYIMPIRVLFSLAAGGLVVAVLLWLKARSLVKPIDRLCQQFTKYRREQETEDIHLPDAKPHQRPLERRVTILEDLWSRFQFMQGQLSHKVDELEQSKRELEQSNNLLAASKQELEKTIHDLEMAKEQERRLIELGHALAEFGHDIGNANGAIMSFVELILKSLDKESISTTDVVKSLMFIRRIQVAANTISGLTTDLLEFAKGKTELGLRHIPLEALISQLDVNLGFIDELPVEYDLPAVEKLVLRMDDGKIMRVLVNLVKNAWDKLEHEDEGEIHIVFKLEEASGLSIAVQDNGSPIPASIYPKLFQAFQTAGKDEGTGLGLAICKKIIEAHGGTITAENLPNNTGVRFAFSLPNCVVEMQPTDTTSNPVISAELPHTP